MYTDFLETIQTHARTHAHTHAHKIAHIHGYRVIQKNYLPNTHTQALARPSHSPIPTMTQCHKLQHHSLFLTHTEKHTHTHTHRHKHTQTQKHTHRHNKRPRQPTTHTTHTHNN